MFISDKFSDLWTQHIFNTKENIFIISLPFFLHEKCPDFFLLTQRQQEAHPSVYDDVVPGDYSNSSCGIFSAKKETIFLHVFLLYIYHSRDSQFSYQRWPPRLSNHYFKTVFTKKSESYSHTAQAMWTKFTAWKHKGNIANAFSTVQPKILVGFMWNWLLVLWR